MRNSGRTVNSEFGAHVHFDIFYNADHVIEINVSTDPLRTLDVTSGDGVRVEFSYSVKWKLGMRHLNVIQPHELLLTDTHVILAMEYSAGGTLEGYCADHKVDEHTAR